MRVLKIQANGIELFKDTVEISFHAQQRVADEEKDKLFPLFSNFYTNTAIGLIGINASGKTSALKLIRLALEILKCEPINSVPAKSILGSASDAVITNYYYYDDKVSKLETHIGSTQTLDGFVYHITKEYLWEKGANTVKTKKSLFDFSNMDPVLVRNPDEPYLSKDVSIVISKNRDIKRIEVFDFLNYTDVNYVPSYFPVRESILNYLDPTIESIEFPKIGEGNQVELKFKGKPKIVLSSSYELNNYISSGTVKGMILFILALMALSKGGYLLIDEIENHFNREIVTTLLDLFMDNRLNINGGVMIYSTHYPDLLDIYDRNDSIFITKNTDGITIENMSSILKRNDIKKSDAYQSSILGGTAPSYEAHMALKKDFAQLIFR